MIAEYSRYFEREAKKYQLQIFNMDDGFTEQLDAIEKYLKIGA